MSLTTDRKVTVANELQIKHKLRREAAAGIMGNIDVETGGTFDFRIKAAGTEQSFGLFQLNGGHLAAYRNFLANNPKLSDSAENQIQYVMSNIFDGEGFDIGDGNRKTLRDAFANGDAEQVATVFSNLFERPGIPRLERRVASAKRFDSVLEIGDPEDEPVDADGKPIDEETLAEKIEKYPVGGLPGTFDQPHPKGIPAPKKGEKYTSSQYPFNHVFETESGHITEYDDSPFGKRILVEHADGSFEEIVTTQGGHEKVVRVEGDSYEIVAGSKFISIGSSGRRKDGKTQAKDALVLTVHGTMRHLVQGDYVLEVEGDYTQKIHGSMHTKVGASGTGNMLEEIKGDFSSRVEGKSGITINKTYNLTVGQDSIHTVKGSAAYTAQGDTKIHSKGSSSLEGVKAANLHGFAGTSIKGGVTTIGATTKLTADAPLMGFGTSPTSLKVNVGNIVGTTFISGSIINTSAVITLFLNGAFIQMNLPGSIGGPALPDEAVPVPGCWVAGTQVLMGDNTYRNIEDLKIGDMVMTFPETKKTRRWNTPLEPQPIISLLVDIHPEIWHLNDSMVSGTEWMIKGDGTAAIVQWLNIGDTVLGPDNNLIKVTRVEPAEGDLKKQVIYNFETKFNYSYTANNMRTIRGRAVRAPERGPWSKEYLAGDSNAYEGSMQDEFERKFNSKSAGIK